MFIASIFFNPTQPIQPTPNPTHQTNLVHLLRGQNVWQRYNLYPLAVNAVEQAPDGNGNIDQSNTDKAQPGDQIYEP